MRGLMDKIDRSRVRLDNIRSKPQAGGGLVDQRAKLILRVISHGVHIICCVAQFVDCVCRSQRLLHAALMLYWSVCEI